MCKITKATNSTLTIPHYGAYAAERNVKPRRDKRSRRLRSGGRRLGVGLGGGTRAHGHAYADCAPPDCAPPCIVPGLVYRGAHTLCLVRYRPQLSQTRSHHADGLVRDEPSVTLAERPGWQAERRVPVASAPQLAIRTQRGGRGPSGCPPPGPSSPSCPPRRAHRSWSRRCP